MGNLHSMLNQLIKIYKNKFLSRWTVLVIDSGVTSFALVASIAIRFNFSVDLAQRALEFQHLALIIFSYILAFLFIGSYRGILRHTSLDDVRNVFKSSLLGLSFTLAAFTASFIIDLILFPEIGLLIFHFALTLAGLIFIRLAAKSVFVVTAGRNTSQVNVLIFGCGDNGIMTKNALQQDKKIRYNIIGFSDDNPGHSKGRQLQDINVYSSKIALDPLWLQKKGVNQIVIAIAQIRPRRLREISEIAIEADIDTRIIPSYQNWINGTIRTNQLKKVKIDDLLQRIKIELDNVNIDGSVEGKNVLVTGAAGSIGSEIARQLSHFNLGKLVLIDHAESPLYDLQQELIKNHHTVGTVSPSCEVANVKDRYRMDVIFDTYKIDIVYHAAAYKHVPMMEKSPYEGIFVNIFGTRILADLALQYNVDRFVMVSSDKAVNPTNVMGATKRVAELYTQSLNGIGKTKFIATRFGNVLGSNGSVVPLFEKQIEAGGPVTVTHEEISRYFMTIPEACHLVLEAGAMGKGGEVFVFDMGDPVKIIDMAKKMIKLSGLRPYTDIAIKITGLRPGEKLHEELLASSENALPTHHPKILKAKVNTSRNALMKEHLDLLAEIMIDGDVAGMVRKVKHMVPEYISQNSEFEALD